MSRPNGYFVDADDLRRRLADAVELLLHVLLVEVFDGMPIEVKILGDILNGSSPTITPNTNGKSVGVTRVAGKPLEAFAFHGITHATVDPANGNFEEHTTPARLDIADGFLGLIVKGIEEGTT